MATSFTELLTADSKTLVKIFHNIKANRSADFIQNISMIADQLGELNHSQLVCGSGFNKHIRDMDDIISIIGFTSYKLLLYRRDELFTTDAYKQMNIDNILDIYAKHPEDREIFEALRQLLKSRLAHIESGIEKSNDPSHIISYRMEIHSIYQSGIGDKKFAEERLQQYMNQYRHLSGELEAMIAAKMYPPSNFFFMDSITPEEKKRLIENDHISLDMIKNRLQNTAIPSAEREMLEEFI